MVENHLNKLAIEAQSLKPDRINFLEAEKMADPKSMKVGDLIGNNQRSPRASDAAHLAENRIMIPEVIEPTERPASVKDTLVERQRFSFRSSESADH